MPPAELCTDSIPKDFEQLDPLHSIIAIGAAQILVQIRPQLRGFEIDRGGIEIDKSARNDLLGNFLDSRIRYRGEESIRHSVRGVRLDGPLHPGLGASDHCVAQSPEDIAPGYNF